MDELAAQAVERDPAFSPVGQLGEGEVELLVDGGVDGPHEQAAVPLIGGVEEFFQSAVAARDPGQGVTEEQASGEALPALGEIAALAGLDAVVELDGNGVAALATQAGLGEGQRSG